MNTNKITAQQNKPKIPKKISQTIAHQEITASAYSGPLPPPEELAGYEQNCPGAATRIITMAEKQAEHRREMEKKARS